MAASFVLAPPPMHRLVARRNRRARPSKDQPSRGQATISPRVLRRPLAPAAPRPSWLPQTRPFEQDGSRGLGVPPDRVYIEMTEAIAERWGDGGETFG